MGQTKSVAGISFGAVLLTLTGCLAPTYRRPTVETPQVFKEQAAAEAAGQWTKANPSDALPREKWWQLFGDPRLNDLEEKISVSNQNVKLAEAQFRESRAIVAYDIAGFFPTVTTQPSITRQLQSGNNNNNGPHFYSNTFNLPVTASWEPDLWGAIATNVSSAKASAQSTAAQLENARLSMQATLASDYFAMEELDMERLLLSSATASYVDALQLTQSRFRSGVSSQIDVLEAQTQLDSTRSQYTDLGIQRAQFEHAIAVLIGQNPSTFSLSTGTIQGAPPPIPTGLPAQLLERRPDVASSERLMAAANENIGLARAAYFPIISLTATGGYESNTWSQWLNWPSRIWALGASAAGTILDFGRHRAQNRQAWAAYDASVATYRQTVLSAFQEVEDNLVGLALLTQEFGEASSAAKGAEDALHLEILRYKAGIDSYLSVITSQNITLTNERTAVQVLGRRMTTAVSLVSAVGGGWDETQLPKGLSLSSASDPVNPAPPKTPSK